VFLADRCGANPGVVGLIEAQSLAGAQGDLREGEVGVGEHPVVADGHRGYEPRRGQDLLLGVGEGVVPVATGHPLALGHAPVGLLDELQPLVLVNDIGQVDTGDSRRITADVRMTVDETRGYGFSAGIDHLRFWTCQRPDFRVTADSREASVFDRKRLDTRCIRINRVDVAVDDDQLGSGYRSIGQKGRQ